ncbi:LacI family DNA-binding transcriptional regulator [Phycicoccus endophyticus]|uniref:LacI family DNA-binding transcriptional regulator n=1 Tax=Phycicoccus endophyticus TaxID=1690220 RepID=A0A7G9R579_9MICO|nr:LacI family DNA-binding transcriptional regulator [Phycicoccus endophyticus]NHI20642.1 LacI family DNA-binding transcriptional regulator [Phycicoccus endophyticus]QNN50754.1 LacI family DNA-binding transcriptional regulator [Phycicoccus endophyticus]GGL43342.1 LacI family transcriptional regulator [Phycicoccus endophyticus]
MRGQPERPTLDQVAAHAGVSRATVSRVVNGSSTVDEALATQVRRAVTDLGYVPNRAARSLMTRRSETVALVAAESTTRVFGDPFFAAVTRGAGQELARSGLHLVLSMVQSEEDLERLAGFVRGGHLDGILVISEHDSRDVVGVAAGSGLPVVVGGRPMTPHGEVPYVDNDNVTGGRIAAGHLLARGCRRVASVAGPQDMSAGVDRLIGFREGLGGAFDPDLVEVGDFTTTGGAAATERLLARRPNLDGIVVANDLMALGALTVLRGRGLEVPRDVAVVGFDDADVAAVAAPPLTTVRQRTLDQGRLMAQYLLTRLGREVAEPMPELHGRHDGPGIVLGVELVARESA